ncbi:MAG: FAD-dependent oxidoreductase, partial [Muribaculaceae bacterium]|nr:FAD-dependent oxidoreductase [Muribaculaceae bacterium]
MLDSNILEQVTGIFGQLDNDFTFAVSYSRNREEAMQLVEFINDVASCSPRLSVTTEETSYDKLEFTLLKNSEKTGIRFRGIPNGHEFTSLLLAVLNADGKGKNLPDGPVERRIKSLQGVINLQTYVSLTCTNCPDIVQALNVIALLNPNITHEMIDGSLFQDEAESRNIQAVPSVYANGRLLHVGRGSLGDLLRKLEDTFGSVPSEEKYPIERHYDLTVLGGGPAGVSAAIYSARKGLRVAIVAERIGGQVKETSDIENLISVPRTTGPQLANDLRTHLGNYNVDIYEERKITDADLLDSKKRITADSGEVFVSEAVIIATGASWRRLNIPGEQDYIGHGVAFCPH